MISRTRIFYLSVAAACLLGALVTLPMLGGHMAPQPAPVPTGTEAFLRDCNPDKSAAERKRVCQSPVAIKETYDFDLMQEVGREFSRMKKTAQDIANGGLTDDAYAACLKAGQCAQVPMLDPGQAADTPEGKSISRRFWAIADAHHLTPEICREIPLCKVALADGALYATRTAIKPVKERAQ